MSEEQQCLNGCEVLDPLSLVPLWLLDTDIHCKNITLLGLQNRERIYVCNKSEYKL